MKAAGTFVLLLAGFASAAPYYGKRVGKFNTHFHDVKGDVYAVDDKTLFIKNFNYDGKGSNAFFWAGSSVRPDQTGFVVTDIKSEMNPLKAYKNQDVILRFPDGKSIKDLRWLSVWNRQYKASFGSVIFPKDLEPPKPVMIGSLNNTERGVSSGKILILDTQTFFIPDFSYDGTGKDAYWWLSRGMKSNAGGLRLRTENGSEAPLSECKNQILVVTLPDGHMVSEYNILSVWNTEEMDDYGSVKIPNDIMVPPSPRTLGLTTKDQLNCEMLNDNLDFETRWMIKGDHIIMQLTGAIDEKEYLAVGFSRNEIETQVESSDVVIAYMDPNGQGHAVDYYFKSTEKCQNGHGMCPDTVYSASDDLTLLNAYVAQNVKTITFQRPLNAGDKDHDQNIYTDGPQAVFWAVGPLSNDGLPETPKVQSKGTLLLDFGREPIWNCPSPKEDTIHTTNVKPLKIQCPSNGIFRAQLGPGRDRGTVWYMNGLPQPDLILQKGKMYVFVVEGGDTPPVQHPLYITSSSEGAIDQTLQDGGNVTEVIYAGILDNKEPITPSAEGRLCLWSHSGNDDVASEYDDFLPNLSLMCDRGNSEALFWKPDALTPNFVYYQSFTEKNMGGRIHVVDFCEETKPALYFAENPTNKKPTKTKPGLESEDDVVSQTSEIDAKKSSIAEQLEYNPAIFKLNSNYPAKDPNQGFISPPVTVDILKKDQKFPPVDEVSDAPADLIEIHKNVNFENIDAYETVGIPDERLNQHFYDQSERLNQHVFDQSERSDSNISEAIEEFDDISRRDDIQGSRNGLELKHKPHRQTPLDTRPSKNNQRASISNPQLEGGFVPLVLNSGKAKETTIHKIIVPPPHMRSRHRPFLFNESVPFHGTFKPGVPDFSGFNISHYSIDELPLLSAPRPILVQMTQKMETIHKANQRLQIRRPELLHYGGPPYKFPAFGNHRQSAINPLPTQIRPHFVPPQMKEEDLAVLSSQRVQLSLQSPGNEKLNTMPAKQTLHVTSVKRPFGEQSKLHPPAIQRRPDFVAEEDTKASTSQRKPSNNQQRFPEHFNPNNPQKIFPANLAPVRAHFPFAFRKPLNGENSKNNERPAANIPHQVQMSEIHRMPYGFLRQHFNGRPQQFSNQPYRRLPGVNKIIPESEDLSIISSDQIIANLPINMAKSNAHENDKPDIKEVTVVSIAENPIILKGNLVSSSNLRPSEAISFDNRKSLTPHQLPKQLLNLKESISSQDQKTPTNKNDAKEPPDFSAEDSNSADVIEIHSNISPFSLANKEDTFAKAINEAIKEGFGHITHTAIELDAPFGARLNATLETGTTSGKFPFEVEEHLIAYPARRQPQFSVISSKGSVIEDPNLRLNVSSVRKKISGVPFPFNMQSPIKHSEIKNDLASNASKISKPEVDDATLLQDPDRIPASKDKTDPTPVHTASTDQEDIKLPHISETPKSHDNGTDYSILNHVLALIGRPTQSKKLSPS